MVATAKHSHNSLMVFGEDFQRIFKQGIRSSIAESFISQKLAAAGITVGGHRAWDIQVKNRQCFWKMMMEGNLGMGESYMNGSWEVKKLDELFFRLLKADLDTKPPWDWTQKLSAIPAVITNMQNPIRSKVVIEKHYNFGNAFFQSFLDPYMQYSCAIFEDHDSLAKAQERKMGLLCKKLNLQPHDHLLDIGCGWGGLMKFASQRTGCSATGVNISSKQSEFAKEMCKDLPIKVQELDYRKISGKFSKAVSVGMFEHVGNKNYRVFMEAIHRSLQDDGVFLLQTIGVNEHQIALDNWITRYIFPNSHLPSLAEITKAAEGLFVIEDVQNIGPNYDKTLLSWHTGMNKKQHEIDNKNRESTSVITPKLTETQLRMWNYYLLSCAGAFRARSIQCWQIVLTKAHRQQPSMPR